MPKSLTMKDPDQVSGYLSNYPLGGVTIGSTLLSDTSGFSASVTQEGITKMQLLSTGKHTMSGKSHFAYSDEMNQGSASMAGTYGMSAAAKLEGSISGYLSNTEAGSEKVVKVNYNAIETVGVEYIDLTNFSVAELMESLSSTPKTKLMESLTKYLELRKAIEESETTPIDAMKADNTDLVILIDEWLKANDQFLSVAGQGIVVGVLWGGACSVSLELKSKKNNQDWKYGSEANFSYAAPGKGVTVKATYDGSNSSVDNGVDVEVTAEYYGAIMQELATKWEDQFNGKSYEELADVNVISKSPPLNTRAAPDLPPVVKPVPSEGIITKIGEIKNITGLEAYSRAAAFKLAQKIDPELDLITFLNGMDKDVDIQGLTNLIENVGNNAVDTDTKAPTEALITENSVGVGKSLQNADGKFSSGQGSDYAPIGAWVANWTDLFPWLATGFDNNITDLGGPYPRIQLRTMIQDLQTLTRLYQGLDQAGVEFEGDSSPIDIARVFSAASTKLSKNIGNSRVEDIMEIMKEVRDGFGPAARIIYTIWNENGFLRDAELGLGVLRTTAKGNQSITGCKWVGKNVCAIWNGNAYMPGTDDYQYFSQSLGTYPVITPKGEILLFVVSDPVPSTAGIFLEATGFLCEGGYITQYPMASIKGNWVERFYPDTENRILSNESKDIRLYPIPYSAALGNDDWKGASMTTGIGSFSELRKQLNSLERQLTPTDPEKPIPSWGLSSTYWGDVGWSETGNVYSLVTLPVTYSGMVEEPLNNIFPKK